MIAADLQEALEWSQPSTKVEIYTPNGTALTEIERAYFAANGTLVLVAKEEPQGQLGLF